MANIVLYGREGCVQCKAAARFFDRNTVKYTYVDVIEDQDAFNKIKNEYGFSALPVIECPREVLDLEFQHLKNKELVKKFGSLYVFSGFRPNLLGSLKIPR